MTSVGPPHSTRLYYRPTPLLREVVAACSALARPFRPTPWAVNRHLQLALLAFADGHDLPLLYDRCNVLRLGDGGCVSLEWSGLDADPATPTVVVLPTVCGDGQSMRRLVRDLRAHLDWRIVVCNRRGHGTLPLTTPRFSVLGSVADLRVQLAEIRRQVPGSPLYGVGVSAGSGLLVRALGEDGDATPFTAAIASCPGYDTTRAFGRVHRPYDRYLTRLLKAHFLERHAYVLRGHAAYAEGLTSRTVEEFQDRCHPLAGFASVADYHAATNPMAVAERIRVPLLVLNAADDPVCVVENVLEHLGLVDVVAESLIALTSRGSHCAFFEGTRRPESWAHRVIAQYLRAVDDALRPRPRASGRPEERAAAGTHPST